jgi:ubiquinone/menaquinone biosynthesis C-methylase UbiE
MLALARERLQSAGLDLGQIEYVHANALAWVPPSDAYDLIVTHFVLDCFPPDQLRRVVTQLAQAARADASWLLADFQVPPMGLRRYRAVIIHKLMYLFFRLTTHLPARKLTPPDDLLQGCNFVLRERQETEWGLLHTDRWERGG